MCAVMSLSPHALLLVYVTSFTVTLIVSKLDDYSCGKSGNRKEFDSRQGSFGKLTESYGSVWKLTKSQGRVSE